MHSIRQNSHGGARFADNKDLKKAGFSKARVSLSAIRRRSPRVALSGLRTVDGRCWRGWGKAHPNL